METASRSAVTVGFTPVGLAVAQLEALRVSETVMDMVGERERENRPERVKATVGDTEVVEVCVVEMVSVGEEEEEAV